MPTHITTLTVIGEAIKTYGIFVGFILGFFSSYFKNSIDRFYKKRLLRRKFKKRSNVFFYFGRKKNAPKIPLRHLHQTLFTYHQKFENEIIEIYGAELLLVHNVITGLFEEMKKMVTLQEDAKKLPEDEHGVEVQAVNQYLASCNAIGEQYLKFVKYK